MTTVVISPSNVASYPEGGGHFWVYMQYVLGMRDLGVDVYWLEEFHTSGDTLRDGAAQSTFLDRMRRYGMEGRAILYSHERSDVGLPTRSFLTMSEDEAQALFARADLLLNFYYALPADLLGQFRRSALVDIDPGLLQFWISQGQLNVSPHDIYFSTGETVGAADALFPDCGLEWRTIAPPVSLSAWPEAPADGCEAFTTVSSWWGGGGKGEFITDGDGLIYENNKRVTFLQFIELPQLTRQPIELALNLGGGDEVEEGAAKSEAGPSGVTDYVSDALDRKRLERHGWRIRDAASVSSTPEAYQRYVRASRGEFSCVKPSCIKFQNAWVSDRTLCYLATGRPVVVQDTGPSRRLPQDAGMFRFSTVREAVKAFETVNADYAKQCREARKLAESVFDARRIVGHILSLAC